MIPAALLCAAAALFVVPARSRSTRRRPDRRLDPRVRRTAVVGLGLTTAIVLVTPAAPELALGVGLAGAAASWFAPARRSAAERRAETAWLVVVLEIWAAAVEAGLPAGAAMDGALGLRSDLAAGVGDAPSIEALHRVAALLRLGVDADRAWDDGAANDLLAPVAVAARRSAGSGAELAAAVREHARTLRRADAAAVQRRSARSAVLMAGPLGLCFLPAFICLGLAPVVIALLDTLTIGR